MPVLSGAIKNYVAERPGFRSIRRGRIQRALQERAAAKGVVAVYGSQTISFNKGERTIRISSDHLWYGFDVVGDFDYYFSAVAPRPGTQIVDFSMLALQTYRGFTDFPILTPSLAEPISTTNRYIELAGNAIRSGSVILDLGSYSGLSSILFSRISGRQGQVVAVDADPLNSLCSEVNFGSERLHSGTAPSLVRAAVWSDDSGIEFSAEGNMGAATVTFVGRRTSNTRSVASMTLSQLARARSLETVDFIKMDIEGSELAALQDRSFFSRHHPTLVIETHSQALTRSCLDTLKAYGYRVSEVSQPGSSLPLLLAN